MEFNITITIVIIAITVLISVPAFSNGKIINDLIFYPARMQRGKELYRFVSHGLIHADFMHLLFNMITFYYFGEALETVFNFWTSSKLVYPLFYFSAIVFASLPDYFKHKDHYYYRSLGASGGVSAILFAVILLAPWMQLRVFFIPMPAIVFAVLYVFYSVYMGKRGGDNINHSAHLWGALYGVVFMLILKPSVGKDFIDKLLHP